MQESGAGKQSSLFATGVLFLSMCILAVGLWIPQANAQDIPRIIFDSDMSSDWDDVGDIAVLHGLASMGECEILGMMVSSQNGGTPLCMDAINTYYGKPDIPIGVMPNIGGVGLYAKLKRGRESLFRRDSRPLKRSPTAQGCIIIVFSGRACPNTV